MICIICQQEKPDGNEHVVPKSLGGSFITKRVCGKCDNNFCSKADAGLVRHFKLEKARVDLQLRGNNGVVPDPLKVALRKPIDSGAEPGHQLIVSPTPNEDGKHPVRTVPRAEAAVTFDDDGNPKAFQLTKFFIDKRDADKADTLIKSALRKAGLKDEEALQRISDFLIPKLETRRVSGELHFTRQLHRGGETLGVTKIAYELAHYWLGDSWLSDPIAEGMRRAILGDKSAKGRYRVYEDPDDGFDSENFDQRIHHAVLLFRQDNALFVNVRLLNVFSTYCLISENADGYDFPEYQLLFMNVLERRPFLMRAKESAEVTGLRLEYVGDRA